MNPQLSTAPFRKTVAIAGAAVVVIRCTNDGLPFGRRSRSEANRFLHSLPLSLVSAPIGSLMKQGPKFRGMTQASDALSGKRVIVLGGGTGIGFAVAELAYANGAAVVIGSRSKSNVEAAARRLRDASGYTLDL